MQANQRWPALALLSLALLAASRALSYDDVPEEIGEEWVAGYLRDVYEPQVSLECNRLNEAEWEYETDVREETEKKLQNATLEYAAFEKQQWEDVFNRTDFRNFTDESLKRQLDSLSVLGIPVLDAEKLEELSTRTTTMSSIYSTAKICPYQKPNCTREEMLDLDPGMEEVMASSRDYDELAYVWKAWRDASGKNMREDYEKYVELSNEAAYLNGFDDMGDMWRNDYDSESLQDEVKELWAEIRPLYADLHEYVRNRLKQFYGDRLDISDGLMPAHILGNMWAQSWGNVFPLVQPFPNGSAVDVTESLKEQGYTAKRMFETSNDFYLSLGLPDNSMSYGPKAMLERPEGKEVVCHASAWDFCNGEDFRIKMCTKINQEDFVTIHHEMGHIQYYIQYKDQPYVFRKGANPGFHEAVGDTIALSVSTPKHLKKVGLLEQDYPDRYEDNINALMSMALEKVAFLPFGLLIDMWRWDVFSGAVSTDHWNEHWWNLRKEYQAIKAPVPRSEDDFDPGAKYHVPGDSQYIAYFIAHILQFQFHKALCQAAGEYDPSNETSAELHKCDIYQSERAGRLLAEGLKLGGSENWTAALHAITGEDKYSGQPLLEYFKPLHDFLREQNAKARAADRDVDRANEVDAGLNEGPGKVSAVEHSPREEGGTRAQEEEGKGGDEPNQLIPITVGCVLGAMLICVLIGYAVFRRKATQRARAAAAAAAATNDPVMDTKVAP